LQYAFIADHQQSWPVSVLCEVLGVGRSGFYDYLQRQAEPALRPEEVVLLERIKGISEKTHHSYGSRRLTKQLQDEGYDVGRFKVRRLMKQAGVCRLKAAAVVLPRPPIAAMDMGWRRMCLRATLM
jgi:hypothetical protein